MPRFLTSLFFALVLCATAQAATYRVQGTFTNVGVYEASGGKNLIVEGSGSVTIEGYVVTDTDQPGYSIIDGELSYSGELVTSYPPFGSGIVEYDYARGYPGSDGVTFYAGGYCSNIVVRICQDVDDFPTDSFRLTSADRFLGVPIAGLRLTGGAGGESFSVAQPGGVTPTLATDAADWSKAVGFIRDLRNVGLFLEGDLAFTRIEDHVGSQPNIVVIQVGSYTPSMRHELPFALMPNMATLLSLEGVYFPESYVTNPDPTASLATLLTGQYAHNHGVYSERSPDALAGGIAWDGWLPSGNDPGREGSTLATWLQDAGYRTGFVGKYLAGYGEVAPDHVANPATYIPAGWDDLYGLVGYPANWMYDYTLNENGTLVDYGDSEPDYQTDVLASKAEEFIRAGGPQPLFLLVSTSAPSVEILDPLGFYALEDPLAHLDLRIRPAPRYAHLLDGDPSNGEETLRFGSGLLLDTSGAPSCPRPALPPGLGIIDQPACVRETPQLSETDQLRAAERERFRHVALRAVDDLVLTITDALSSIGQLDDTVVIFTAATGGLQGHLNQFGSRLAYRDSIRVPLTVRAPTNVAKGANMQRALLTNTDIAPTLASIAGVQPPYDPDGFNRKLAFDGHLSPGEGRDYFLIEHWFMPGFDRFAAPSYLAWRARWIGLAGSLPYSRYISTRANPQDPGEVTARELTRSVFTNSQVPLTEPVGEFYDTILDVFHGCEGAQCREYERER